MDAAKLAFLKDFVSRAAASGSINYDWTAEIYAIESDHVCVRFYDDDIVDETEQMESSLVGKLYIHSDTLMAWQEADDEPIIFSARPWILVAITYAGP